MAGADGRGRKPMGIWLDPDTHAEAERIADVADLTKSQVIRLAVAAGLPVIARRIDTLVAPSDYTEAAS